MFQIYFLSTFPKRIVSRYRVFIDIINSQHTYHRAVCRFIISDLWISAVDRYTFTYPWTHNRTFCMEPSVRSFTFNCQSYWSFDIRISFGSCNNDKLLTSQGEIIAIWGSGTFLQPNYVRNIFLENIVNCMDCGIFWHKINLVIPNTLRP